MTPRAVILSQIEYLITAKYPTFHSLGRDAYYLGLSHEFSTMQAEVTAYRAKLKTMSVDQLQSLYDKTEKDKEQNLKARIKRAAQDQKTHENGVMQNLRSDFDYVFWARMPYWTCREATALTLGISPCVAKTAWRSDDTANYPIATEYKKLNMLVRRAIIAGDIADTEKHIMPFAYLKWIKRRGIDFPSELAEHIMRIYGCLEHQDNIKQKPLLTKERETFLKMIAGMAFGGYGYDPRASKSSTVKEIHDDLALRGIMLDQDTIRSKLKEAAQLVTEDAPRHMTSH